MADAEREEFVAFLRINGVNVDNELLNRLRYLGVNLKCPIPKHNHLFDWAHTSLRAKSAREHGGAKPQPYYLLVRRLYRRSIQLWSC